MHRKRSPCNCGRHVILRRIGAPFRVTNPRIILSGSMCDRIFDTDRRLTALGPSAFWDSKCLFLGRAALRSALLVNMPKNCTSRDGWKSNGNGYDVVVRVHPPPHQTERVIRASRRVLTSGMVKSGLDLRTKQISSLGAFTNSLQCSVPL